MKNGHCPKCNSANVYTKDGGLSWGAEDLLIDDGSFAQNADCVSYICIDCGYFENYIVDMARLQKKVQKNWTKVA
jgi:hypothetical protein